MANDIKVKFSGDTSSYSAEIKKLIQQSKTLSAEYKNIVSNTDKATKSDEKNRQANASLVKQIQAKAEIIKAMTAQYNTYTDEEKKSSTEALKLEESINKQQSALNKLKGELDGSASSMQEMVSETDAMLARKEIADVFNRAADAVANYGGKLLSAVVDTTKDFDSSMSNVLALSGATADEFNELRQKARDMGATTKYSATEAADALGYMALAGWDTNEMVDGLDGVLNLAAASGMELAEASDIVTDFLSAFGKEAKDAGQMADMMAYAQAHSNTTTRQLGEAFRNSAANMHTAGQSMETTTALLEAMANQGNKGSEAGTALAAMMRDLTQKMKNGKIMIGDTAIQVMDANGNFRNMIDILADVEKATDGMGTAEKTAAIMTTFTSRSVKGVNQVLTEGTDNLYDYEKALKGSSGAAGDMADTMQDNLNGQLTILKSQLQELAISVGDQLMPYIRKGVEVIQKIIDKFNEMPPGVKKLVAVMLGVGTATAIIVPKLISLVNTFKSLKAAANVVSSVNKLTNAMSGTAEAAGGMGSMLGSTLGSIGKYAGIIGGVVAAIGTLNYAITEYMLKDDEAFQASRKNTEEFKNMAESARNLRTDIANVTRDMDAESGQIDKLSGRLLDLNSKTTLTKSEQAEYKNIVQQLTKLLPDFNGEIDESTGKLKDQTQATKKAIDAMADTARAQRAYEKLNELLQEQVDINLDVAVAQGQAQELADRAGMSVDELRKHWEKLNKLPLAGLSKKISEIFGTTSTKVATQYVKEIDAVFDALDSGQITAEECEKKIELLNKEIEEGGYEMSETADEAEGLGDAALDMADDVEDASEDVEESFEDIYNSAKENLESSTSLLDEWAKDSDMNMAKVMEILKKNAVAWANWSTNVETLTGDTRYQTDKNFKAVVDAMIEHGAEAAPAMQELADAVRDGNDDMIKAWLDGVDVAVDAKDKYVKTMANYEAATKTAAQTVKTGTKSAFKEMADNAGVSVQTVRNAARDVTGAVSKESFQSGAAVPSNYALGMNSKMSTVGVSSSRFKGEVSKGFYANAVIRGWGADVPNSYASGMNSTMSTVGVSSSKVKAQVSNNMPKYADIKKIGENVSKGLADGIAAKVNLVNAAASNVANVAIRQLRNIPQVKSPSRVTREIGEYMVEGLALGLEATKPVDKAIANLYKGVLATPTLSFGTDGINGKAVSKSLSYGDINVTVNGSGVTDEALLARKISDQIFRQVKRESAAYA